MNNPLFQIRNLHKKFGDNVVVNDLNLEIKPGECLGVIGPNGAGKTTTIRMCLGLVAPDSGYIEAFGLQLPRQVREAKRRMGVVTQFDSLDPDFTCTENLQVYGRYFGLPAKTIQERIPKILEFASLQNKAKAKPGELELGPCTHQ
jgi:lipooligosaccharide transport system ATP-binding protein